ncbi:putative ribonuclease H-like domain-containing protein [Tanacetum coccineum]
MKKMYCLVDTYDYSRFSWVFFLAIKDETSEILKTFITGIENLIDLNVKVIRCDNWNEFKNKVMNQFFEMKGIKREFSVARTPQQNGVAEKKNRTLIEAARTMLADLKLPTTFWAEAVNTVCYVQTKGVLYKLQNKTHRTFFLDPSLSSNSKDSPDVGFKPLGEEEKMDTKNPENENSVVPNTEEPRVNQEQDESINITNNINIVSLTVNTASIEDNALDENIVNGCIDDPNMPNLEEIVYSDDDEEVGAEADMNNLAITVPVGPIPTTRVHKDHPLEQIIRDIHSAPQTRRMIKNVTEHVEPKKVWTLMDLPHGKRAIGTKWVYRNKKDERGIVIRNKARLVTQGYTQEEGIDYDEVFALFYLSKIAEEVNISQPLRFEDLEFPDKVYKVEKVLYGLHEALRACQDKYVDEILKKFGFSTMKTTSIPIETSKPLLKDAKAKDVDDSTICLEAYTDNDYASVSLDRKSTIGGCQFLRRRLISRKCKKQTIVANSTTKAEYVAASSCHETVIKEWEDRMERAATTASSLEAEQDSVNAGVSKLMLLSINLLLPVLVNAARHSLTTVRHKLMLPGITSYYWFWATAKAKTVNEERQIQALVDKKNVIITKKSLTLLGAKITAWNEFSSTMASAIICLATNQKFNFSKYIFDHMMKNLEGEVLDLEEAKTAQAKEIASLKKRVNQLEKRRKLRTSGLKRLRKVGLASRVESSNDVSLGDQEDASKLGRKIVYLDVDAEVTLIDET